MRVQNFKIKGVEKIDTNLMFSHKSDDWSTPKDFYDNLDHEFHFDMDPCPLRGEKDGLCIDWIGNIFCNPPYSNIRMFLEKGIESVKSGSADVVVFLIPSRTDTSWFHDLLYGVYEIRFIRGRLKFGSSKNPAPFPSMIVIVKKELKKEL
jgi:site-specific DNA-methyltransferase (adenine-specific)